MFAAIVALSALFFLTNSLASVAIARHRAEMVWSKVLVGYHGEVLVYPLRAVRQGGMKALGRADVLLSVLHVVNVVSLLALLVVTF